MIGKVIVEVDVSAMRRLWPTMTDPELVLAGLKLVRLDIKHGGVTPVGVFGGEMFHARQRIAFWTVHEEGGEAAPTPSASPASAEGEPSDAGPDLDEIETKARGYAKHLGSVEGLKDALEIVAENIRCAALRARREGGRT